MPQGKAKGDPPARSLTQRLLHKACESRHCCLSRRIKKQDDGAAALIDYDYLGGTWRHASWCPRSPWRRFWRRAAPRASTGRPRSPWTGWTTTETGKAVGSCCCCCCCSWTVAAARLATTAAPCDGWTAAAEVAVVVVAAAAAAVAAFDVDCCEFDVRSRQSFGPSVYTVRWANCEFANKSNCYFLLMSYRGSSFWLAQQPHLALQTLGPPGLNEPGPSSFPVLPLASIPLLPLPHARVSLHRRIRRDHLVTTAALQYGTAIKHNNNNFPQ